MGAPEHIVVLARWRTTLERIEEVLQLVAALRQQSLAEPGCLGYEAFRRMDDAAALVLVERYRDGAAMEAHRSSAHYRELVVDRIIPILLDRQVELLRSRESV